MVTLIRIRKVPVNENNSEKNRLPPEIQFIQTLYNRLFTRQLFVNIIKQKYYTDFKCEISSLKNKL